MNEQNIENVSSLADNQNPASENNQPNIAERYKQMAINDINTIKQLVGNGVPCRWHRSPGPPRWS